MKNAECKMQNGIGTHPGVHIGPIRPVHSVHAVHPVH